LPTNVTFFPEVAPFQWLFCGLSHLYWLS